MRAGPAPWATAASWSGASSALGATGCRLRAERAELDRLACTTTAPSSGTGSGARGPPSIHAGVPSGRATSAGAALDRAEARAPCAPTTRSARRRPGRRSCWPTRGSEAGRATDRSPAPRRHTSSVNDAGTRNATQVRPPPRSRRADERSTTSAAPRPRRPDRPGRNRRPRHDPLPPTPLAPARPRRRSRRDRARAVQVRASGQATHRLRQPRCRGGAPLPHRIGSTSWRSRSDRRGSAWAPAASTRGRWLILDHDLDGDLALKAELLEERHDEVFAALDTPAVAAGAAEVLDLVVAATGTTPDREQHPLDAAGRLVQEDLCLLVERDGAPAPRRRLALLPLVLAPGRQAGPASGRGARTRRPLCRRAGGQGRPLHRAD